MRKSGEGVNIYLFVFLKNYLSLSLSHSLSPSLSLSLTVSLSLSLSLELCLPYERLELLKKEFIYLFILFFTGEGKWSEYMCRWMMEDMIHSHYFLLRFFLQFLLTQHLSAYSTS
jgi:hypothetical protein